MLICHFRTILSLFICLLSFGAHAQRASTAREKQNVVAMRMIGHELLLASGDYLSRVLPIEQEGQAYRIRFAADLAFDPDQLVTIVDSVMRQTHTATSYVVEVEQCATKLIVYSFEISATINPNQVACKTRAQPKDCYSVLVTLLEPQAAGSASSQLALTDAQTPTQGTSRVPMLLFILVAVGALSAVILVVTLRKKKKQVPMPNANTIAIGQYLFDTRNMALWYNTTKDELTSKEADLLALLHASVNTTVERDVLLKNVWGDEGAYVGRTLDVFISKLRKKLEADPNIRIVNVRGIGYKLILGGEEE
jgi:hypothetical protein